jgi:hypothetical protein
MRERTLAFMGKQSDTLAAPMAEAVVWTQQGAYVFTSVGLHESEVWVPDATPAVPVLAREARLLSVGAIAQDAGVLPLGGLSTSGIRTASSADVTLRNDDDYFGKLLATVTFLSSRVHVVLGYRGMDQAEDMGLFQGLVQSHTLRRESLTLHLQAM